MDLTPLQIDVLRALLRSRVDGSSQYLSLSDLRDLMGKGAPDVQALSAALPELSDWFRNHGLPDVTAVVIPSENADRNVMLPDDSAVERLGGLAAAHAEANRVRDFDWIGWRDG
ncbi:hypothetical protein [uncultured Paracoccus sp.]|uniref:hypothetical protein n=1 Tax=uncultured Paracoccus sp. TaxID=189685 RepID=UPI00263A18C1|nr:hypothetical protein [uncultured Paracoccus sp.]